MNEELNAFGMSLAKTRAIAVDYRNSSGIEKIWQEDSDFYDGVDESNRQSHHHKPTQGESLTTTTGNNNNNNNKGSNLFINLTQWYVDGSAARVIDMLTPSNEKPFAFKPTPIATTVSGEKDLSHIERQRAIQEVLRDIPMPQPMGAMPGMPPPPAPPKLVDPEEQLLADIQADAEKKAKKAEDQVWDWLDESGWQSQIRLVIQDMAKVGTGVLKGPCPNNVRSVQTKKTDSGVEIAISSEVKPASKRILYSNFFPDPSCGDDIHSGSYTWERDFITAKQLKAFKHGDYIDEQIDEVLKEGPSKAYVKDERARDDGKDARYEIWYYHGTATYDDMLAAGCDAQEGDMLPVVVTMVNDRVIKAAVSVLDTGDFPYDMFVWQAVEHSPWGKGISRIVREAQRMLNAAVRNMLNNAGIACGPQIIFRDGVIYPADGVWEFTPLKLWMVDNLADAGQVSHAIESVVIPSLQNEMMNIIRFAMEMAERVSSMPLMMQGDQGSATTTVGGMEILQKNASTVLRRIARMFDDRLVPHLQRYYEYLLIYGKDDDCKGDFQIHALGSTALYERDAASNFINNIGQLVLNPIYGLSPAKWIKEFLRGNKIDGKTLELDEEEKAELAGRQPQQDPRIAADIEMLKMRLSAEAQAEQAKEQAAMALAKMKQESLAAEIQLKQDSLVAEMHLRSEEAQLQRDHEIMLSKMKYDMEMMQFAEAQKLSLETVKSQLASTALKLKTQKELSRESMALEERKHQTTEIMTPPVEPMGRAPDGEAFAR